MKKLLVLTLVLAMVFACGFVFANGEEEAAPTGQLGSCFLGPSGLVIIPTAETLGVKEGRVSVLATKHTWEGIDIATEYDLAIGYGATDNLEIGAGAKMYKYDIVGIDDETNMLVFAKYALPISSSEKLPAAFAAGATYMETGEDSSIIIAYGIASASLSEQIKGHLGLGIDKWESEDEDGTELFYSAGLEAKLMPALTVSVETIKVGGEDDNMNAAGLRYAVTPQVAVTGAMIDFETGGEEYNYYLGVAYNW